MAKKVKKVAKTEKVEKPRKAQKTNGSAEAHDEDVVTIAELAAELKISPQSARVKLRAAEIERGDGRWKWPRDSKALEKVRKVLGL